MKSKNIWLIIAIIAALFVSGCSQQQTQNVPNNWRELRMFRTKFDVSLSYDQTLLVILEQAYLLADGLKHREVSPLHVLVALLQPAKSSQKNKQVALVKDFFARLDIHYGKVMPKLKDSLEQVELMSDVVDDKSKSDAAVSRELQKCLIEGYLEAQTRKHERVQALDILVPLLVNGPILKNLCAALGITI